MKPYEKWRYLFIGLEALLLIMAGRSVLHQEWTGACILVLLNIAFGIVFFCFWHAVSKKGIELDRQVSRVLGKDAKEALSFGQVGIITYNNEYVVTWASGYFKEKGLDLVNHKLTEWIPELRKLFEDETDTVTASSEDQVYEIVHKENSQVLFVRNITELSDLKTRMQNNGVVVGLMTLDNYAEYQSYENEEMINQINQDLRTPLINWARENEIFFRRMRSDRFLLVMDTAILDRLKADRFSILQKIKDIADSKDLSITLSMVFSYGCDNFATLDRNISQLLELVSSRGGDQVALKKGNERVEYIGGNSEKTSQRSKVRVHIMENTIQDLVKESDKVFVLGHVNSDYDSMGAALAASSWAQALGKKDRTYIVLKDVPADRQLKETMEIYQSQIGTHHRFITEAQAMEIFDPNADAVFMVDHSDPRISSGKNLLENSSRTIVIDHHRRSESSVAKPLLCYIESTASSTCELMTELLQSSTQAVPIYEAEATIMYLGILVDTNRFKTHTSERTFQAAGTLRGWGANSEQAEKALQLDYDEFRHKNALMEQAELYKDGILIDAIEEPLTRTDMSKISDALLNFKGCKAAFTVAVNKETGNAAVSARSDGSFNVQKIMEKMNGGGHFAAAALEREGAAVKDIVSELKQVLDEEVKG